MCSWRISVMLCFSWDYIVCERSGSSGGREDLEEKVAIFCTYGHPGPGCGDPEGVQLVALGVTLGVFFGGILRWKWIKDWLGTHHVDPQQMGVMAASSFGGKVDIGVMGDKPKG
jgi:hypothetical protein